MRKWRSHDFSDHLIRMHLPRFERGSQLFVECDNMLALSSIAARYQSPGSICSLIADTFHRHLWW